MAGEDSEGEETKSIKMGSEGRGVTDSEVATAAGERIGTELRVVEPRRADLRGELTALSGASAVFF